MGLVQSAEAEALTVGAAVAMAHGIRHRIRSTRLVGRSLPSDTRRTSSLAPIQTTCNPHERQTIRACAHR